MFEVEPNFYSPRYRPRAVRPSRRPGQHPVLRPRTLQLHPDPAPEPEGRPAARWWAAISVETLHEFKSITKLNKYFSSNTTQIEQIFLFKHHTNWTNISLQTLHKLNQYFCWNSTQIEKKDRIIYTNIYVKSSPRSCSGTKGLPSCLLVNKYLYRFFFW